ncbi:MAG: MTH1187 family thiamine-binding protein [Exilispira sp.]
MKKNSSCAIQVVPVEIENRKKMYEYIDYAISIIKESGLKYLVTPFETVIEGDINQILSLIEKINNKLLEKGLRIISMNIKIWSGDIGTIEEKLENYK